MSQIAIISDIHFGVRNDSDLFIDFAGRFFKNIFFPKIDELGIKTVINLGDTFDRRKFVNFKTLKKAREIFFDPLVDRNIWSPTLIGNHDTYHKNNNDTNSIELLLNEYQYYNTNNDKQEWIDIINKPQTIITDNFSACMIPWINPENEQECLKYLQDTKANLCMGHFPIKGFVMHSGQVSEEGLDREIFEKFDMVFTGHYHHRSTDGKIHYLGNPYEMTWHDYNDTKGFHIFDTVTNSLEFIPNPYRMFHRIVYNDSTLTKPNDEREWEKWQKHEYTDAYVKVVVQNKQHPHIFELFMEEIYKSNPFSINIVSNFIDVIEAPTETIDQSDDTVTLMTKYIDRLHKSNPIFDIAAINKLLIETYHKALNENPV